MLRQGLWLEENEGFQLQLIAADLDKCMHAHVQNRMYGLQMWTDVPVLHACQEDMDR